MNSRKLALSILFIGFQLIANSQEWALFPLGQNSTYEIASGKNSNERISIYADSVSYTIETTEYFFHTKQLGQCSSADKLNELFQRCYNDFRQIKTCLFSNNETQIQYKDNNSFYVFKNFAQANETFTFGSYAVTCDSIGIYNFLSVTDSARFYHMQTNMGNISIVLTKNYGVTKFVLISSGSVHALNLQSIYSNYMMLGRQLPQFQDYFHLKAGDVLFWSKESNSGENQIPTENSTLVYKDSITNSITDADSAVYTIVRFGAKGKKEHIVEKYYKSDYNELIFSPYNGVAVSNLVSMFDNNMTIWQNNSNLINSNGDIQQRSFSTDYISIRHENCEIAVVYDLSYFVALSTEYGVSQYGSSACCFNHNSTEIIGSIINGVHKGTTVLTGIGNKNSAYSYINIAYNQGLEIIQINSNVDLQQYTYSIFDINGRMLISNQQLTTNVLDFKLFGKGLYLLELRDKLKYCKTFKFVK